MSDTSTAPVATIWNRDEKAVRAANVELSVRRLQAQAQSYLVEAESSQLTAQAAYNAAIMASLDSPDFSGIVLYRLELQKSELTVTAAREEFTRLFEVSE